MSEVGSIIQGAMQSVMKKAVELAPDSWVPGGRPDPLSRQRHGLIGAPVSRIDGPLKVKGAARFAAEFALDGMAYVALAYSTIAKGRIATIDTAAAERAPGVVLVMTLPQRAAAGAAAGVPDRGKGGGGRQPADHAGRSRTLERTAGRAGARRDAGTGRSCEVADPHHL